MSYKRNLLLEIDEDFTKDNIGKRQCAALRQHCNGDGFMCTHESMPLTLTRLDKAATHFAR